MISFYLFPVACQVVAAVSYRNGCPKYGLSGKASAVGRGMSLEGRNSSDGASREPRKTGFFAPRILAGSGGPFYVIYLNLRNLEKTTFRATFASNFLIDGGMRLVAYVILGLFRRSRRRCD